MIYTYRAKCINVVDGDTFDLDVDLGFFLTYRIRVRLKGADTPEIRAATEAERKHAREAKAFAQRLLLDKEVTIHTHKEVGIYGRYTASVVLPDGDDFADKLSEAALLKKVSYD
jgi:micrococcal nuclease